MQVTFSIVLFIASPVRILVVLSRQYYNINTASRAYGILQSSAPAVREALQHSHYVHFIPKQSSCAPSVTRAAVRLAFSIAEKHCKTKQSRFFFFFVGLLFCFSWSSCDFFPNCAACVTSRQYYCNALPSRLSLKKAWML